MTQLALIPEPSTPQQGPPAPWTWATGGNPRAARHGRCRRCRATILTGLDEDLGAVRAFVDPIPLTPLGEAIAIATGRRTYEAIKTFHGRLELKRRTRWSIKSRPPGGPAPVLPYDVLPAHRCHDDIPDQLTTPSRIQPTPGNQPAPDTPPPF